MKKNQMLLIVFLFSLKVSFSVNLSGTYTNIYGNSGTIRNFYGNNIIVNDIVIQSKCILVLKCGIYRVSPGVKITIEAGGQLCLYDAILTQSADNSNGNSVTLNSTNNWLGIEVLGNDDSSHQELVCPTPVCSGVPPAIQFNDGPLYNHGVIVMYKSKIRYSDFGVTLGGKILKNSHFGYYNIGQSGGQIYTYLSAFENNYWRHILFASYSKSLNKSILIKNEFNYEQGVDPILGHQHRDIIAYDNSFKYNVEKNIFNVKSVFNNFYGIELLGSYMRINDNVFKWHIVGVLYNSAFGNFFSNVQVIHYNTFDQCQVAIDNCGGARLRVEKNPAIKSCGFIRYSTTARSSGAPIFTHFNSSPYPVYGGFSSTDNGTVGIYNGSGGYNLQCNGNSFTTKPVILNIKKDASIITWKSGALSSLFMGNTLNGSVSGFRSVENNLGFKLGCNTFSLSRTNDILNDANGLVSTQGSTTSPTGNIHSRRQSVYDINNLNSFYSGAILPTLKWKYYFKNNLGVNQTPAYITNNTVQTIGNGNYPNCSVNFVDNFTSGCDGRLRGILPFQMTSYTAIKSELTSLLVGGIDTSEEDEYNDINLKYDLSMMDMVDHLVLNGIAYEHSVSDSIKQFLIAHNTLNSKVYMVDWYLSKDSFNRANDLMDTLMANYPTNDFVKDFVEFKSLTSLCMQADSTPSFLFNHFNDFKDIADSLGYFSRSALGIAQFIANSDSTNTYFQNKFYFAFLPDVTDSINTDTLIRETINVYPVPFTSSVSVDINNYLPTNRTFNVVLKDLDGTQLFSYFPFVVNANTSNNFTDTTVSSLGTGLYILQVFENGVMIDVRLINK